MGLFFIVGALLIFANSASPDIQTNEYRVEAAYYDLSDEVDFKLKGTTVSSLKLAGMSGIGFGASTIHRENRRWKHTLDLRYFRDPEYHVVFATTGIEFTAIRPRSPLRIVVGAELGRADWKLYNDRKFGSITETTGWEIHTSLKSHFVAMNHLFSYHLTPSLKSYEFQFRGDDGISDVDIDGAAAGLSAGVSMRF